MKKKMSINDFFYKWFFEYKKTIRFSIINNPSQALKDSFNAGYTLSQKQVKQCVGEIKRQKEEVETENERLRQENERLRKQLEDDNYFQKRA